MTSPAVPAVVTVPFAKGHGTENDFVLIPDADGRLDLTPDQVAALCDRRAGIGADGLIRVVRAQAVPEGRTLLARAAAVGAETGAEVVWFMDYRNADGSAAEMCGNGLRVFVRYLEHRGWIDPESEPDLSVLTRAGIKQVRREGPAVSADLGAWRLPAGTGAVTARGDVTVTLHGGPGGMPGLSVDVGNPHVVVVLPDVTQLAAADLTVAPRVDPAPPQGTNVEVIVPLHDTTSRVGHLRMRVYERGVGETRSCGTGAVAAVVAARAWAGPGAPEIWDVDVPGGRLRVSVPDAALWSGTHVQLTGPAVIVAEGTIELPAARD